MLGDGPDDRDDEDRAIDMPMEVLLGKPPRMTRDVTRVEWDGGSIDLAGLDLRSAAYAVLRHPTVASKRFLVTIADRTVGGLTHRDQMVGPWQVPVADVAVTLADHVGFAGEAMATGERMPLASVDAPASGRMAVGEALTNLLAAPVAGLSGVKLSCNWMAACGEDGEDAALYDTVEAVAMQLLPELGVSVPVGKDSLSMRTRWTDAVSGEARQVTSPVSLVVTAFASLPDVRGTWTPQLHAGSALVLVDLGAGRDRLGGSILAQVSGACSAGRCPTSTTRSACCRWWRPWPSCVLAESRWRTTTVPTVACGRPSCEMAFAGAVGVELDVPSVAALFAEELGVVLGVPADDLEVVEEVLAAHGLGELVAVVGRTASDRGVHVSVAGEPVLDEPVRDLAQAWDEVSWRIAALRDNPACAQEEHDAFGADDDPGPGRGALVRPDRRRGGALPVARGPAEGRDPARAGGQQPRRDGVRLRQSRVRHLRRAHDRPADRALRPGRRGRAGRLRRLLVRRHARRG